LGGVVLPAYSLSHVRVQTTIPKEDFENGRLRRGNAQRGDQHQHVSGGANVGIVAQKDRAGFFDPEFGRQSQGFRTKWLTDVVTGWTKAIALWRVLADTANNVPVTCDAMPTSPVHSCDLKCVISGCSDQSHLIATKDRVRELQ